MAKIKRNSADMQDARKEIFGPLFESMLQEEMDNHLGYKSNSKEPKSTKKTEETDPILKPLKLRWAK